MINIKIYFIIYNYVVTHSLYSLPTTDVPLSVKFYTSIYSMLCNVKKKKGKKNVRTWILSMLCNVKK